MNTFKLAKRALVVGYGDVGDGKSRPRRSDEWSMMSSWIRVAVWIISRTAAYRTSRSPE